MPATGSLAASTLFAASPPTSPRPRLPQYRRADESQRPPMRLTPRDSAILEALHAFDGVLSDRQIKRLFFSGPSQMHLRLRLLYQHGYVTRPDRRRRASLTHMVYWLDRQGAEYVAGLSGVPLAEFAYRREPRWLQLDHDLAVNDVRLTFLEACHKTPGFVLEEWIPQSEFWAQPDKVDYTYPNGKKAARYVRPDGFCVLRRGEYYARLLLEVDRASEDNPRVGREKFLPGVAYLRSATYKRRFGYSSGRWLFVTTSPRRLHNLKRQAETVVGQDAKLFYFTTFDQLAPQTLLADAIWWRGGESAPTRLLPA
jgi:hypothetical protein